MRPNEIKMVACFYAMQSQRSKASAFVTEQTAREIVEAGQGHWSKNGKHLIFAKTRAEIPRAAESLTMGPAVTEGNAAGVSRYVELVNSWRSTFLISCSLRSASA